MAKAKWIFDGIPGEHSIEDFEKAKEEAIKEWNKACDAERRAHSRVMNAESAVLGCIQRIRFLKMLEGE